MLRNNNLKGGGNGDDKEYLKSRRENSLDDQLSARDVLFYLNLNDDGNENQIVSHDDKKNNGQMDLVGGEGFQIGEHSIKILDTPSITRKKEEISHHSAISKREEPRFIIGDQPISGNNYEDNAVQKPLIKSYYHNQFPVRTSFGKNIEYYDKNKDIHVKSGAILDEGHPNNYSRDLNDGFRKEDSVEINQLDSIPIDEMSQKESHVRHYNDYYSIPKTREVSSKKTYDPLLVNLYHENISSVDKEPYRRIYSGNPLIYSKTPVKHEYLREGYTANSDDIPKEIYHPINGDFDLNLPKIYRKTFMPVNLQRNEELYKSLPESQGKTNIKGDRRHHKTFSPGGWKTVHHREKTYPVRKNVKGIYTEISAKPQEENLIPVRGEIYRRIFEEKSPIDLVENNQFDDPYEHERVRLVNVYRKNYGPLISETPFTIKRQYISPLDIEYPFYESIYPSLHDYSLDLDIISKKSVRRKLEVDNKDVRLLSDFKNDFYKAYKDFVETLQVFYSESHEEDHSVAVEKSFNKLLSTFKNYQALKKAIFPDGIIPESLLKSMKAAENVKDFFSSDNDNMIINKQAKINSSRRLAAESVRNKPISTSIIDFISTKNNFISALNSYYNTLKVFKDNSSDEHLDHAVEAYRLVLNNFRKYDYEYNRYVNTLPENGDLSARGLTEKIKLRTPELPKDLFSILRKVNKLNSTSMTKSYIKQKLQYGKSEQLYLEKLIRYHKLPKLSSDDSHENDLEAAYKELKEEHDKYSRLYMYLFTRDALPEEEKIQTFRLLPDISKPNYLSRTLVQDPNTTKEYDEILRQHDSARLSYLEQLLEYSSAVTIYYVTNSTGSYLNAIDAYKKLIDLRGVYYDVYLYVFDNQITDSPIYPFPKLPKLFIHKSYFGEKLGVRIRTKDFTDMDLENMEFNFEMSAHEYDRLSHDFIRFPDDEILYQKTLATYTQLLRRHAVCEYLYHYLISNSSKYFQEHHEPDSLKLNLEVNISKLNLPKSVIVPIKSTNVSDLAKTLFEEKRSEVLREKIEQIRKDYEVTLMWYYAMADLLKDKGQIKEVDKLNISNGLRNDYLLLKMYYGLCEYAKKRMDVMGSKITWECFLQPLPETP